MITNNTMDDKQKKEYTAPKMDVFECKRESELLCASGDNDCVETKGW
ncbi:MAG: hypothetical protein J5977_10390 [Fibrobacter sp.]|nr:hypothetical protein [Fibrobacter sp.]